MVSDNIHDKIKLGLLCHAHDFLNVSMRHGLNKIIKIIIIVTLLLCCLLMLLMSFVADVICC